MSDDSLNLVRLAFDRRALMRLRTLRGRPFDESYMVHAGLAALFAESDQPTQIPLLSFAADDTYGRDEDPVLFLLAYSELDEAALSARMRPEHRALVRQIASRPMPVLEPGTRAELRLRACPVRRVTRDRDGAPATNARGKRRSREVDVYLASRFPTWTDEPPGGADSPFERSAREWQDRESVYAAWLAGELERFGPAARIDEVRMERFRRARLYRKHSHPRNLPTRPDVTLTGAIEVVDTTAFTQLLRRGVGRHRAFGFGMLRIRPAR